MRLELNAYEISEAVADYLIKRGITPNQYDCYEMLFSTTEVTRQVKKHKNGRPVVVKRGGNCYPQWEEVDRKTVWHTFDQNNDLAIYLDEL